MKLQLTSRLGFLLICSLLTLSASACFAKVIRVSTAGNDYNSGWSWSWPKKTVRAAIDAAVSGDQIWVAKGTYVECITLKLGVKLYGGFRGNEMQFADRDWTINVTVLDGNDDGCVVTSPSGATASTVIDGFTIRNGYSRDYGPGAGGITCRSSSPTIANNTITENDASYAGGGIYCYSSSPMIVNNTITANLSNGIYCDYYSSPTVTGNTIIANWSGWLGAGIICDRASSPTITDSVIADNHVWYGGGGIACSGASSPTIANNLITRNTASVGGGLYCENSSPKIMNNTITQNEAHGVQEDPDGPPYVGGGGIYWVGGAPLISNNVISANRMYSYYGAGYGGGISCWGSSATIANNTITENTAPCWPGGDGGAISCAESSSAIVNNIVAFNSSGVRSHGGPPVAGNNCVYNPGGTDYEGLSAGTGDISVDPKLVATEYGQVHIQPDSPCKDAGDDSAVQPGWTDMDDQARVQGDHVDMGADESDGTAWTYTPPAIRVSPTGNDANDGSTWALAKRTLQAGVNAASLVHGDVWASAGVYDEYVELQPYAFLYGGFAGTENTRDERNWRIHASVIDGRLTHGTVGTTIGHRVGAIDGFTIRNSKGDGIECFGSSPRISNNVIAANGVSASYGGISCDGASPDISNNLIIGNKGNGVNGDWGFRSIVTSNTITANGGYGVRCGWWGSSTIVNNIVAFNASGIGEAYSVLGFRNNCFYNLDGKDYYKMSVDASNICADPLFADRANGDYHLTAASPCINKGLNTASGLPTFDFEGEGRIFGGTVDIGADEWWSSVFNATEIKGAPEGALVKVGATPVSADWANAFYVENEERTGGIRVEMAGHPAVEDDMVSFTGKVKTSALGERLVAADTVTPAEGTFDVKPFGLANRMLGGGVLGLQDGVWSRQFVKIPDDGYTFDWVQSSGLNNIGLLVTTFGNITHCGEGFFYVDDGSALDDGSGYKGVKVLATGLTFPSTGFVKVTGISSCEKNGDRLVRLLRVRKQDDIQP